MQENISYKEKLLSNLKDKEYRTAFISSHINNGIPFQIRTMRNNRNLTQEELAVLTNMKQAAICRLENPNYGNFTLKTLKEVASAFDVALIVKFVPFSELVKWDLNLSSESLDVISYKDDPFFKERTIDDRVELSSNINECIFPENTNVVDYSVFQERQKIKREEKIYTQQSIKNDGINKMLLGDSL
jgi:transcriptional regulator with XRE-family HTH domain